MDRQQVIDAVLNSSFPLNRDGKRTKDDKELCPCGGSYYVVQQPLGSAAGDSQLYTVLVTCGQHSARGTWAIGTTYAVGDTMISGIVRNPDGTTSNKYIFRCIRAHTSGTTSRTRDPALRSNKSTWMVVGYVDGAPHDYSSTVRYGEGVSVIYNNAVYYRTNFNLVGGQVPYDNRSSDYWIYGGPATP